MSLELSESLQQALDAQTEEPLRLVDPRTQHSYVLVPADLFDRLKELQEEAEEEALQKAWLNQATKTRRAWAKENPY